MKPKRQVAALPVRRRKNGRLEVCLVTSRETHRWVIPKGWPEKGLKDWEAAEREAFEEAGLSGRMATKIVGKYPYWKRMDDHFVLVEVRTYLLDVEKQRRAWPEKKQRERRWMQLSEAAEEVLEPGLVAIFNALEAREDEMKRREKPRKDRGSRATRQGAAVSD